MQAAINTGSAVTVQSACKLQQDIASHFATGQSVVLDVTCLLNIDLSFIQIIESARLQAESDGLQFSLSTSVPEAVQAVLDRAGLSNNMSPADTAFWFDGERVQ